MVSPGEAKALAQITELLKSDPKFNAKLQNDIRNTTENNHTMIITLIITVLAVVVVSLRMYARTKQRAIGIEDWFVVVGTVLTVGHCGLVVNADMHGGVGRPAWSTSVTQFSMALRMMFWSFITYPSMMGLIRASILLFYRRLFGPTHPKHQLLVKILLVLLIPATIAFTCLTALMCTPIQAAWNPWERAGSCKDMYFQKFVMGMYSTSLAFDVIILVLPLRAVWQLQLPNKQKWGVVIMLLCGASACLAVMGRIISFQLTYSNIDVSKIDIRWVVHPLVMYLPPNFDKQDIGYWIPAQFEPCVALIGSSLPALRYFFRASSDGTTTSGSTGRSGSSGSKMMSSREKKQYSETGSSSSGSLKGDIEAPRHGLVEVNLNPTVPPAPPAPFITTQRTHSSHSSHSTHSSSNQSTTTKTTPSSSRAKKWLRLGSPRVNTRAKSVEERREEILSYIEMQGGLGKGPLKKTATALSGGIVVTTTTSNVSSVAAARELGLGRPRGYEEYRLSRNSPVIYTPPRQVLKF